MPDTEEPFYTHPGPDDPDSPYDPNPDCRDSPEMLARLTPPDNDTEVMRLARATVRDRLKALRASGQPDG